MPSNAKCECNVVSAWLVMLTLYRSTGASGNRRWHVSQRPYERAHYEWRTGFRDSDAEGAKTHY